MFLVNGAMEMRKEYDIAIIDSGLFLEHRGVKYDNYSGIHFFFNEKGDLCIDEDIRDEVGHGTAIYSIIRKENPLAQILVVKVFEKDMECQPELMAQALSYISSYYQVKIINISNGITCCDSTNEIKNICDTLIQAGTIIVAAFANTGGISYPAAFSNVIGVDMSLACKHIYDYEFVEEELINIRAVGITQKLPWLDNQYKRVSGTSFSCPYISSYIYKECIKKGCISFVEILSFLKEHAIKNYEKDSAIEYTHVFQLKKAIVFPFNKEMHSIVRYSNLLIFEIEGVYDVKQMGNCGKYISNIIKEDIIEDFLIEDFQSINWEGEFDTVILGHTRELHAILNKDIREYIVKKCIKYNKKIISFDDMRESFQDEYLKGIIYTPIIEKKNVPGNRFGKLYKIGKPIICVTGTSSKQGKFTTQLYLRNAFLKDGYNVGSLGTEPSAELFGMDEVYPMGYDATTYLDGQDEITMVNYQLHKIEEKEKDIIIVGSQSQTVAYSFENLRYIPIHQNNFLYACDADGYILIVNYYDDDDYILKNIRYLENISSVDNTIIAIGLFPEENDLQWTCLTGRKKIVDLEIAKLRAQKLQEKFNIPVYVLGMENDKLYKECIMYFGEE